MTDKTALFVGCSFTANCGFSVENLEKYHWPYLFCQENKFNITNHAAGGMSNHEIFLRTIESITNSHYDLVVVMWSEVDRKWAYFSDNNIDDFTILNNCAPTGFRAKTTTASDYAKLHYSYFNNRYINIKHWLQQCLALEKVLKHLRIPFIFAKGFENDIIKLNNVTYDNGFDNINGLEKLFDFENRPDDYILSKLKVLQMLVCAQDSKHWVNLTGPSFDSVKIDVADDGLHPGPETNKAFLNTLNNFYRTNV
jgi:hypothetical protein